VKAIEQAGANLAGRIWAFGTVLTVLNIAVTCLGVYSLHVHG
jgi:hypothetical protein